LRKKGPEGGERLLVTPKYLGKGEGIKIQETEKGKRKHWGGGARRGQCSQPTKQKGKDKEAGGGRRRFRGFAREQIDLGLWGAMFLRAKKPEKGNRARTGQGGGGDYVAETLPLGGKKSKDKLADDLHVGWNFVKKGKGS